MLRIPEPVFSVVEDNNLKQKFFVDNLHKAESWIQAQQKSVNLLDNQNILLVAPTGGGKTVIALLTSLICNKRTLFLVPTKRLTDNHQSLFEALSDKFQTVVITGDTPEIHRDWHDLDDRIVFATGDVAWSELQKDEMSLDYFDMIVFDEVHNATSLNDPYSLISDYVTDLIWCLALTATPGNSISKMFAVQSNCNIDQLIKIDLPSTAPISSIISPENFPSAQSNMVLRAEQLILDQLNQCLANMNMFAPQLPLGKEILIDSRAVKGYSAMSELRTKISTLAKSMHYTAEDRKLFRRLTSHFGEFGFWAHIYDLFKSESFEAIKLYLEGRFASNTTVYAKRIRKAGNAQMLLAMTNNLLHPKIEALGELVLSLWRTGKTGLIFISNKGTAQACYKHIMSLGIPTDVVLGNSHMSPTIQKAVLANFVTENMPFLISSIVLREGYNLSFDYVLHMTPPKGPNDLMQRNGRAGRGKFRGGAIYIVAEHEKPMLFAVMRKAKLLSMIDFKSSVMPKLPRRKKTDPNVEQYRLF